ncbi:glycoside hydrolase family 5 protein [Ramlibacter sp. WS9]|uniref:glycoside hydrolase family 5 protein n=1 Tax=Ramlibacter sp. WS9 TaxID=1882741 RepID=UPI001E4E7C07|nr:cellulase family glycosylhydrolase [Ramlibacter sp. WS9]
MSVRLDGRAQSNIEYTLPRRADVAWLAANGYTKSRLPIRWERLQPMLHDTAANTATSTALGNPGNFHEGYASYITGVLDAHAAAGIKCIIDVHNSCRYDDFVFQADGSVIGLAKFTNPVFHPYTDDSRQVRTRIFALAAGATLTRANYSDFMSRIAARWKAHPGFGGYGLMNEPFNMPRPGQVVESIDGRGQDLTIWPAFARAAVDAIRGIDPVNPIYVGGNDRSSAWTLGTHNPGFPLPGVNIIYEVRAYLDAFNNGDGLDFDLEAARNSSAGVGTVPINLDTGVDRLRPAVDWAKAHGGSKLALTETGMPLDDPRWEEAFKRLVDYAGRNGVEIYSWGGGNHWTYRNKGIHHMPGWHQNKTLEPAMSGPMKWSAARSQATIFDDGPGWAGGGGDGSVTITVYARGNLGAPVTLNVSSSNGGILSKTALVIPAGPNGQDTFTFTPGRNRVATLTYTGDGPNVPPPRKVFSLSDPVAYAATSVTDAAMAIMAKYSACKWELADGHTDYMLGVPAADGQVVRAISDSGYGSSPGNAMEMVNWTNAESSSMGTMVPPVMRTGGGRKRSDHSAANTHGFWCRKTVPSAGVQPKPRNRVLYEVNDPHFAIAAVSVPGSANSGIVFQASNANAAVISELAFVNSRPQAKWIDSASTTVVLTGTSPLVANTPAVFSMVSTGTAQQLRINAQISGRTAATFATSPSPNDQMLLGWGFLNGQPRAGFGGSIYSTITGRGAPSADEMAVLERYLALKIGITI